MTKLLHPLASLLAAAGATTAQADVASDQFEVQSLTVTSSFNTARSIRLYNVNFNFFDTSTAESGSAQCSVRWNTKESAPVDELPCDDQSFIFQLSNFQDLKTFDLALKHKLGECGDCDSSAPGQNNGTKRQAFSSITQYQPHWARTRTTSGGTVSAIAAEDVMMPATLVPTKAHDSAIFGGTDRR